MTLYELPVALRYPVTPQYTAASPDKCKRPTKDTKDTKETSKESQIYFPHAVHQSRIVAQMAAHCRLVGIGLDAGIVQEVRAREHHEVTNAIRYRLEANGARVDLHEVTDDRPRRVLESVLDQLENVVPLADLGYADQVVPFLK